MEERALEDFFNSEHQTYKTKKTKTKHKKTKLKELLKSKFSFNYGVDLSSPVSVLYRRNYCIKNIISLANLVFIIFSFIGISKSNYIVTIAFFLLVNGLSWTIKIMLNKKNDDFSHQTIIMYLQCLFVFVLSIVLYIKVYLGFAFKSGFNLTYNELCITDASYILIYFTIVIMSLYQNPKLITQMFGVTFIPLTIIHLTLLHPDLYTNGFSIKELINYCFYFNKEVSIDILLRTIVFLVFYVALYSETIISSYIFKERKNELSKRIGVETNFKDIMESLFDAVKVYNDYRLDSTSDASINKVKAVSKELAVALNMDNVEIDDLMDYSTIHISKIKDLSTKGINEIDETNLSRVIEKTKIASRIIKRLELSKKAEDVTYAVFEGNLTNELKNSLLRDTKDLFSSIIILSEIYSIMREDRSYKKALNHQRAMEMIVNDYELLFSSAIISRFVKYNKEIQNAYDNA